jgi:Protein of unknown function (DUF3617)
MKTILFVAAGALALGACDKSPKIDETNATPAEVAQKARETGADAAMISAGLWQSKVTIEKFDMPGMPPEMMQRMKAMTAENQAHDFETCLTREDVAKPKEDFFAGKNNQCRYEHFTMGGGKIDAVMHCGKGEGTQTMRLAGTYSPDNYQMQMATEVDGTNDAEGAMQMQLRVEAKRVGECSAKQG